MSVSVGAEPARAKATRVSTPRAHERAKATSVSRERFVMPAGYGGAWPVFDPTRRTTHQRPGTAGMEGAGGHKGARPRCPWAAGPGQATHRHPDRLEAAARPAGPRRSAGGRRQGQSKHTRTKPRPIGGRRGACGAWPGFETTRRAKLAARTASGRAGYAAAGDLSGPQANKQEGRRPPAHPAARPHRAHSPAAISGSQAPSGSPTPWRHPPGRAGARNRRRRARGPRPRR